MKKTVHFIIITLFLSSWNLMRAQEKTITGVITDNFKKPIQYVNVGFLNKPVGTVTNDKGEFLLNTKGDSSLDTLRISCLGFKTIDLVVNSSDKKNILNYNFVLEYYTEELKEIIINSNKLNTYTIGKEKTNSKNEVFFTFPKSENLNLGSEIGRSFSIGAKRPSLLKEFKFYIKNNNFEKTKFRINIYAIENEIPSKKINDSNIFIEAGKQYLGWVNVDLSKYDIKIQQDIIITVEWLEGSKSGNTLSFPVLIPSFSSKQYYKQSTQTKWKRYNMISPSMLLTYKQ